MSIPDYIDSRWAAKLDDKQLVAAEAELHADFHQQELVEKGRSGQRYMLLQGPAALIAAWLRWTLVNNEVRTRGIVVYHPGAA